MVVCFAGGTWIWLILKLLFECGFPVVFVGVLLFGLFVGIRHLALLLWTVESELLGGELISYVCECSLCHDWLKSSYWNKQQFSSSRWLRLLGIWTQNLQYVGCMAAGICWHCCLNFLEAFYEGIGILWKNHRMNMPLCFLINVLLVI